MRLNWSRYQWLNKRNPTLSVVLWLEFLYTVENFMAHQWWNERTLNMWKENSNWLLPKHGRQCYLVRRLFHRIFVRTFKSSSKRLSAVSLQKLLLVGFSNVQPVFILKYMLWLNIFLCFKLIVIYYHAQKETEMKVKPMTYWAALYTHVNIVPINSAPYGIWILVSLIISPTRWF